MKALRVLATATVLSAIAGSALAADEIIVTEEGVSTFLSLNLLQYVQKLVLLVTVARFHIMPIHMLV